jgi:hypothetical protein
MKLEMVLTSFEFVPLWGQGEVISRQKLTLPLPPPEGDKRQLIPELIANIWAKFHTSGAADLKNGQFDRERNLNGELIPTDVLKQYQEPPPAPPPEGDKKLSPLGGPK